MVVVGYYLSCCFFFFKQKTAYEMRISDWSSDVCSSDLGHQRRRLRQFGVIGGERLQHRADAEQSLGFLGEGKALALHHLQSRLGRDELRVQEGGAPPVDRIAEAGRGAVDPGDQPARLDRKSTRLNSSH